MGNGERKGNVVSLVPGSGSDQQSWDEWHVPARDDKGHHARLQVKVPPQLIAQAQMVVESKHYPYRSIGYLYRHALLRHFHWLAEGDQDGTGSTIHTINAMVEIVREDEYMEDFRSLFDRLDDRVRDHRQRGNDDRARQLVLKVWAQMKQMGDDFWRREFEEELKRRYGNLLKGD